MQPPPANEYVFGPYRIRSDELVLRIDDRQVALAPKLVDTLMAFASQPDRFVSKAELIERIWPDGFVDEANLTQNIYVLRKMFAAHNSGVGIENVPKRGYRLVVLARAPEAAPQVVVKPRFSLSFRRIVPALMIACTLLLGIGGPMTAPVPHSALGPYGLPPVALQHYLLGRYYLNRATGGDLRRSIASFTALVREYPQSALGYAGLADSLTSLTFATADPVTRTRLGGRAIALANEAVARETDSADSYAALGAVQTSIEHDDVAAATSFETSLRLDPRNVDALVWYGTELMNEGRVAQARRLFERAMSVDPSMPGPIASLAWADFLARDFVDAAAFAQQLLRAHRLESIARITLANSYVELGDFGHALPAVEALRRGRDTRTQGTALLARIYASRGLPRLALKALGELEARTDPDAIGSWDILALAAAYARLGREDAAFVWLARIRSAERRQVARDPRFDRLRNDPRLRDWLSG